MPTVATVLSWHDDPDLRDRIVDRMRRHHTADTIVQNDLYQELDPNLATGYRGCAIGCLLDPQEPNDGGVEDLSLVRNPANGWHAEIETQFGIPAALARIVDGVFVALPADEAPDFALHVAEAVPVGRDLTPVISRLMLDLLADPEWGVHRYTAERSEQRVAVELAAELFRHRLAGLEPGRDEWEAGWKRAVCASRNAGSPSDRAATWTAWAATASMNFKVGAAPVNATAHHAEAVGAAAQGNPYVPDDYDARRWQAAWLVELIANA